MKTNGDTNQDRREDAKKSDFKSNFKASLKSMDTEEHIDLYFYRPIGYAWAVLARKLGVTPNAITIASIFLGLGAGVCFYFNNIWINLLAMFLLIWADSFDSADGQLARMTGQYSRLGRILDGLSGDIWFAAIYVAICLRENVTSEFFMAHHWVIWVVAVVTGICHGAQAAMGDYYRQFHLYFLKGESGSELERSELLREKYDKLSWKHDFFSKLVMMFYLNYTLSQENRTPRMQSLRRALRERFHGDIPQWFRDEFRAKSLPLMKYTNILSFNTRTIALFCAVLIFRMPWLYFAFELTVLNLILLYMVIRHERICRDLEKSLQTEPEEHIKSNAIIQNKMNIDLAKVKGLIFDYGGTLDTGGDHWSEIIWAAWQQAGIGADKAEFREAYVYAERELARERHILPQHDFHDMLLIKMNIELQWLAEQGLMSPDAIEAKAAETAKLCYESARASVEKAAPVLDALSQRYPMVLVSNFYGNIETVLADFGINQYFKAVIESAVIGVRKPDPRIFEHGVKALDLLPAETLVIGDSYRKDIVPAESIGCQAIWLKGKGWTEEEDAQLHPNTISQLDELLGILL